MVAEGAFYGACHDYFRVGDTLFRAVEDEYDGYRSALDELLRETVTDSAEGLFNQPIAMVKVVRVDTDESFDGYHVIDADDGHRWLEAGTDYECDYYPVYVFSYSPKPATP